MFYIAKLRNFLGYTKKTPRKRREFEYFFFLIRDYSSIAFMLGSVFPSRNSSIAPPPVEI